MKATPATIFILGVLLSGVGHAQQTVSPEAPHTVLSVNHKEDSPAQQRIAAAEQQLKADPKRVQAYNELAIAYLQRARETADATYLKDADSALVQGLKLDAEDFNCSEPGWHSCWLGMSMCTQENKQLFSTNAHRMT